MSRTFWNVCFLVILGVIVFATLSPINLRPNTGHLHPERITAFALLGATLCFGHPRHRALCMFVACALACGLEYAQTFIPTRDGRLADAVEKAGGAVAGVALAALAVELSQAALRSSRRRR